MNMKIATTRLADPGDNWHGPVVEITTDDHMTSWSICPSPPRKSRAIRSIARARCTCDVGRAAGAERDQRTNKGGAQVRAAPEYGRTGRPVEQGSGGLISRSDPVATVVTSTIPKRAV